MAAKNFLVMIEPGVYFIKIDGADTIVTKIPSAAAHFSYQTADRIARTMREQDFEQVVVATLDGRPATAQAIIDANNEETEFTVRFNEHYYFAGRDRTGLPTGSRDTLDAKFTSREAAGAVCGRLRRMGFRDALVMGFDEIENSLQSELKRVWKFESEFLPDTIKFQEDQ